MSAFIDNRLLSAKLARAPPVQSRLNKPSYNLCAFSLLVFMPTNNSELQTQARVILDAIAFTPFEQCLPLSREFGKISARPGIYAIRHKTDGLLYIGKTKSLRSRFIGGHKAFLWAWLDKYSDEEVRIAVQPISYWENPKLLLELEAIILRTTEPPYNVQIPSEQ